ncbi:MAG: Rieske (2Fe-2S) protein [Longimicrobiales bacterium]|nr:Rieske (2Fe-2S) protein [Longimicrobiales bacterium]
MSEIRHTPAPPPDEPCEGCGSCLARREFLRVGVGAAAVAALAALFPGQAAAVRWTEPTGTGPPLRYPVPQSDGVEIDKSGEVILVRQGITVFAFALSCPHERSMLRWREGDGIFRCSKHHSEYSSQGVFQKGRATRNMDRLAVRLEGNELVVDPDTVFLSDENPEGWASALVSLALPAPR